jgi:hypothetical protein
MDNIPVEINEGLWLDANAVGGLLWDVFGMEMTAAPAECAHCGNQAEVGTLLAFTLGPGVVLRCSACGQVVLRIVQTPDAIYLDASGAAYLKLAR